jgi:hypothetical protein
MSSLVVYFVKYFSSTINVRVQIFLYLIRNCQKITVIHSVYHEYLICKTIETKKLSNH